MEFFRRLFHKPPQEQTDEPPYAGENAIAEHEFFASGELLHGGETSAKKIVVSADELHARADKQQEKTKKEQEIAAARKNIENITAPIAAKKQIKTTTIPIHHSPLEPKPTLTVLDGGGTKNKKPAKKIIWHSDDSAEELPVSGQETLNEHIFFGPPKKQEKISRIAVSELDQPIKKPRPPAESPSPEEKRAA